MNQTEPCLLCGGNLAPVLDQLWDDRFGAPGYYAIASCDVCGTEQTTPRPPADVLRALYEEYYNFGIGDLSSRKRYETFREYLLNSSLYRFWLTLDGDISFHGIPAGPNGIGRRLLDVGCNEGRGLVRYRSNGFETEGLELNRVAAETARTRGFKVYTESIETIAVTEPFDIIVFSNVLEHTRDPRETLKAANRLLKKDGEIWISLPNSQSLLRDIFGRHWINWHVPYHLVHFNSKTLWKLLQQEHFAPISWKTVTPALWVVQTVLAAIYSKPGRPTKQLRRMFLVAICMIAVRALLFPLLWGINVAGRGDALLVRARRMS